MLNRHLAAAIKILIAAAFLLLAIIAPAQTTITASSSATTPADLAAGSYARLTLAPGPNTLTIDVSGTYSGQLALKVAYQGNTGPLRAWASSSIADLLNAGVTGLSANATGLYTVTVPGPGYAYVVATSLASGTPSVFFSAGSGQNTTNGISKSNGATLLSSFSTAEATNAVTSTPASLTLDGGTAPTAPIFVIVTNGGSNDAYVSPVSGGHTWLVPAGSTVYIPTGSKTLYAVAAAGTTTLYSMRAGY